MARTGYRDQGARSNRWLSRNVAAIALLSLFSDMGYEMVTSVMPFFIVTLGGARRPLASSRA